MPQFLGGSISRKGWTNRAKVGAFDCYFFKYFELDLPFATLKKYRHIKRLNANTLF